MRLPGSGWWRIVAVYTATLAALLFGILSLRGNRAQPKEDPAAGYRLIEARLVDERQLPQKLIARRRDGTWSLPPAAPGPPADGRVTTLVLTGQTGAAIQELRREATGGDSEALTNLAAALLTHRPAVQRPSDSYQVSITLEALVVARKAIAQSPTLAAAHFNLALALVRLGFTPEARVEFESAATLESDAAWSAEARRQARELRSSDPLAVSMAATSYIRATASREGRTVLKEYLGARERPHDHSHSNGADVNGRLERAAELYGRAGLYPEFLPRVFVRVATALSPRDQSDLYMQRYVIAGGLIRAHRREEAIALLRTLDADVFRARGEAGLTAQMVCEQAIHMIVKRSPPEALDVVRDAFHSSSAKGEPWLTALYADFANEVRTHLLQSALGERDIPKALEYTDASIPSRSNGASGTGHKEQRESRIEEREIAGKRWRVITHGELLAAIDTRRILNELLQPSPDGERAVKEDRLVKYGDILDALQPCRDLRSNDIVAIAQPKPPPVIIAQLKKPRGEVQRALAPDAAIVEYATVRDQVIAFVIRTNDLQAVSLYASVADVKNAAAAMWRADDESFAAAAGSLYELILAPIAARLEGVSTVAFIPYRDLVGIPFGALLDVQRGQFLIERLAVNHARTTRAAITAARALKPAREQKVLAIAATDFDRERYPDASALPSARRESDSIAKLSGCARLMVGPAATAEAIQRQLVENVVIHYAGHIVRRGADVWLPLKPAAGRDGLSATEIARMPLKNSRVVVLAACRGASPGDADELMPTMADAFLTAGVPAVIASSYDVDDSDAPATMRRLHTYLRDGGDAADALRKTTIEELRRGRGVPPSLRFMAIGGAASLVN
jgi:CHAT domain-containing protein